MANPEHLAILEQGVAVWNRWRKENPDVVPDLYWSSFEGARLPIVNFRRMDFSDPINFDPLSDRRPLPVFKDANLRWADLTCANVSHGDFINANLEDTRLRGANLSYSVLSHAGLSRADLSHVNLDFATMNNSHLNLAELYLSSFVGSTVTDAEVCYSNVFNTKFINCDLNGTDFSNSRFSNALFAGVDLSLVIGLDTIDHLGPSTIGIDTIIKSKGQIPEVFLRGCGVPDEFIDYIPSLLSQPFNYYSCFISHSSLDKDFCERLYNDLRGAHVRTWYFPEDAKWGRSVWGEIDRSINIYDKLVLVCSKNSLQSGPVLREIERALNREDRDGKHILFPITIDDYVFETWQHPRKADVLAKIVGSFIGWGTDTEQYNKSFKRLLDNLNADE